MTKDELSTTDLGPPPVAEESAQLQGERQAYRSGDETDDEKRREYLGGSDAAAVLSLDRYTTPYELYLKKVGLYEPERSAFLEEAALWGRRLEAQLIERFSELEDCEVISPHGAVKSGSWSELDETDTSWSNMFELIDPERDYLRAHVDGFVVDGSRITGIVDAKNRSSYVRDRWSGDDDFDPSVLAQGTHYQHVVAAALNLSSLDFHAAVLFGGNSFERFKAAWHDERVAHLVEREDWFWACVIEKRPPPMTTSAGSDVLDRLYAVESGEIIVDPGRALVNAAQQLKRADVSFKNAKLEREEAQARVKAIMRDASRIEFAEGASINWKAPKPRTSVDYAAALVEFRNQLALRADERNDRGDVDAGWVLGALDAALAEHTSETEQRRRFVAYLTKLDAPAQLSAGETS